jgi:arsenate reductase (thioredoxin)
MDTILFVCQHGGAKSVIAASYLNQLGLPFRGVAAAAEDPYDEVPAPVVEMLQRDGVDVSDFKPRRVDDADLEGAARVVSIGCDLPGERWDDVPPASEDLEGSAAAIRRHVDALVAELRDRR